MSDQNTILAEIEAVTNEVQELLRKSGMALAKAEDEEKKEEKKPEEKPAEAPAEEAPAAPEAEAPKADAIADQAVPAEAAAEEAVAEHHEEGQELHDAAETESPEQLAAEAQTLSDEELDMLLECLMSEKEGRQGAHEPMAAEEAPAEPAEKSMPSEFAKLGKSMDEQNEKLAKSLETLVGTVTTLAQKVDQLATKQATPVAQPKVQVKSAPAANASDVQVLHKSTPIAKRLTKSETQEFLYGQMQKGNKLVNSELMHAVTIAKSEEELHAVQDNLVKKGIELPKL